MDSTDETIEEKFVADKRTGKTYLAGPAKVQLPLRDQIMLEVLIDDVRTNVKDPRFMQAIQAIGMTLAQISVSFGPKEILIKYKDETSPLALSKNLNINVGKILKKDIEDIEDVEEDKDNEE